MGFKFANKEKWMRKGLGWFVFAAIGLLLIVFKVYMVGPVDSRLLVLEIISALSFVLVGICNWRMPLKDYIRVEDDVISIYRGPILPRKTIFFSNIDSFKEISELIVLRLKQGNGEQFNANWLAEDDLEEIKKLLGERIL